MTLLRLTFFVNPRKKTVDRGVSRVDNALSPLTMSLFIYYYFYQFTELYKCLMVIFTIF